MSPYVGSALSLGGAKCSERDESGIFCTFRADIGGVEGPYDQPRGGMGVLPGRLAQYKGLWSHNCEGLREGSQTALALSHLRCCSQFD